MTAKDEGAPARLGFPAVLEHFLSSSFFKYLALRCLLHASHAVRALAKSLFFKHEQRMNGCDFTLHGARLKALGSGALWWPDEGLLCVSDLHLGKSERMARRGGSVLPPYETRDTLERLEADINSLQPATVICLGDSFDDLGAALALGHDDRLWINRLQAGRAWIWIEGNHDPGPVDLGGSHLAILRRGPLTFTHIATTGTAGEVSGHYHPKASLHARGRNISRPAFLIDSARVIMPAFGTYTGGLRSEAEVLNRLMQPDAQAIMTGKTPVALPMPR